MDIKSIARTILPFGLTSTQETGSENVRTRSKTDAGNDREGNGQSAAGEQRKPRELSPEEIDEAIQYLESLPGVKDNNLIIRLEHKDGVAVVYVEDRTGKVVRRIPPSELSALTANREKKSGHLLNKAM